MTIFDYCIISLQTRTKPPFFTQSTLILVLKCFLSTFLTILENFNYSKFFNFGESSDPNEKYFSQNFFALNHLPGAFHKIFQKFKTRRQIDPMGKSLWNRYAKFDPEAREFPAVRNSAQIFAPRGISEPLGQISQISSAVTSPWGPSTVPFQIFF